MPEPGGPKGIENAKLMADAIYGVYLTKNLGAIPVYSIRLNIDITIKEE